MGKGGGGGGYSPYGDYSNQYDPAAGQAYLDRYPDVAQAGFDPGYHYKMHGEAEGRQWGTGGSHGGHDPYAALLESMAHQPHSPSPEPAQQAEGPSYEEQMAEQARIQGERERDQLFSAYMDAAGSATDYINSQIEREQSNAALMGVDFEISDEQKNQRINDYFATLWGAGEQQQLEALMGEWGNPTGFGGWTVTRGDASAFQPPEGGEQTIGTSKGMKPKVPLVEDEVLGGTGTTALGG